MENTLGKTLRAMRMTQQELAARIGVSKGFVSEIVSGKKRPSVETLQSIAEALDISIDTFWGTSVAPGFSDEVTDFQPTDPIRTDLAHMFRRHGQNLHFYQMTSAAPGFALLEGDVVAVDFGRTAKPGEIALFEELDDFGESRKIVARWFDPWLERGEPAKAPTSLKESARIVMRGPVVGSARGIIG
ncbi:helix-turn-helix domain-containing protein [Roseovarius indicus]|uniref:helix-turn-helix domain-containing protein n=1 Tax=Roseovarius indicus TaxID=540747 RepID=UPI0032EE509B